MSYTVSAQWAPAIKASHTAIAGVDVLLSGVTQSTPNLRIIGGNVTVDKTNDVRRRCTVTLEDPTGALIPTSPSSLLTPYGNELRLWRGVTYVDGTSEMVPLGVFRMATVRVRDSGADVTIEVTGYDRARAVQRAKFTDTYSVAAGTDLATAIQALITSRVSGLTFSFANTTATTPGVTYQAGDDPWKAARELATAGGYELFFDADGICVLRPEPDTSTAATVWDFTEGSTNTATSLDRAFTDENVYSDVIATGEGTGVVPPVRGQARDTTTTSPTYYLGSFGDVPYFFSSPLMVSAAIATVTAAALLNRLVGFTDQVGFTAVPNPALDVSDVVTVTRQRLGLSAAPYVVDRLTIPLDAKETMSITSRLRRS
jgi:hypothetical protein